MRGIPGGLSLVPSNAPPPCPKCGEPMERHERQFFWRGDYRPGHVCVPCNALYAIKGEEIAPLKTQESGDHL